MSPDSVSTLLDQRTARANATRSQDDARLRPGLLHAFTVEEQGAAVMGFRASSIGYYFVFVNGMLTKITDWPPLISTTRMFDGAPHRHSGPPPPREIASFVLAAPSMEPSELYPRCVDQYRRALEYAESGPHGEFNPVFLVVLPLLPLIALTNPSHEEVAQEFDAMLERYSAQQFLPGASVVLVDSTWGPAISKFRSADGSLVHVYADPVRFPKLRIEVESMDGVVRAIYSNYDATATIPESSASHTDSRGPGCIQCGYLWPPDSSDRTSLVCSECGAPVVLRIHPPLRWRMAVTVIHSLEIVGLVALLMLCMRIYPEIGTLSA